MTIDLRAKVYCSLGPLISGEISDSYAVDAGLVYTTGSCVLSGVFKPNVGDVVQFSYAKNGNLVRIPRRLRVLSCFADPLRNQTTLQLGCPLTYKAERGPAPEASNGEDDEEVFYSCEEAKKIPTRKTAKTVFQRCCDKIGVKPLSVPLTNSFLLDKFDYSPGYVQIMDDLLKSEGYLGYINAEGDLKIVEIDKDGGSGPVFNETNIIDISPMNSGDIPAGSVAVSFNTQTLKEPEDDEDEEPEYAYKRNWEFDSTNPDPVTVIDKYTNPVTKIEQQRTYTYTPWSWTRTSYDSWDRVSMRFEVSNGLLDQTWKTTTYKYAVSGIGSGTSDPWWNENVYLSSSAYLGAGASGRITANTTPGECDEQEEEKPDGYSDVVEEAIHEEGPLSDIAGACGFPNFVYPGLHTLPGGRTPTLWQYTYYEKDENTGITKTTTVQYKPFVMTPDGAHSIGARANLLSSATKWKAPYIVTDAAKMVLASTEVKIRTEREFGLQKRPGKTERLKQTYSRDAPVENLAKLTYAIGSESSDNVLTVTVPYSPDDYIEKIGDKYLVFKSDAKQKAKKYGKTRNRLLLGSNSGISVQVDPDDMPNYPLKPIYIQLKGIVGQYVTNAQSWAFDSQGIVCSCDALYWGAVGAS